MEKNHLQTVFVTSRFAASEFGHQAVQIELRHAQHPAISSWWINQSQSKLMKLEYTGIYYLTRFQGGNDPHNLTKQMKSYRMELEEMELSKKNGIGEENWVNPN